MPAIPTPIARQGSTSPQTPGVIPSTQTPNSPGSLYLDGDGEDLDFLTPDEEEPPARTRGQGLRSNRERKPVQRFQAGFG